jgi:O-antigen/teichoic acid export membrane protein
VICRSLSIGVTLLLTRRLEDAGYGRTEFAFNIVFWLILIVRDGFETIVTRELARHPRLTRNLVNHVIGVRSAFALTIYVGLSLAGFLALKDRTDLLILQSYGLLLITTALGLDFVYRGTDRIGLVAISLITRMSIYSLGVWICVQDVSRIVWVPLFLASGEAVGIGLVWSVYSLSHGIPRPVLSLRFLRVLLHRGRSVCVIHLSQAVISSSDLMVVGLMSPWAEVGHYGASHRMVAGLMAFGLIFQQVVFPTLARSWRLSTDAGRNFLNLCVRVLLTGFVPIAVGGALLADPLVAFILPPKFQHTGILLALGVWRVPVLSLAFLYQSALVAMNRESAGIRLLVCGALCSTPMIALFRWQTGLPGASLAVLLIGVGLVVAGYFRLCAERKQPSAHHHLVRPLLASVAMAPVCLYGQRFHVVVAVGLGAVVYLGVMKLIGGLNFRNEAHARAPLTSARVWTSIRFSRSERRA